MSYLAINCHWKEPINDVYKMYVKEDASPNDINEQMKAKHKERGYLLDRTGVRIFQFSNSARGYLSTCVTSTVRSMPAVIMQKLKEYYTKEHPIRQQRFRSPIPLPKILISGENIYRLEGNFLGDEVAILKEELKTLFGFFREPYLNWDCTVEQLIAI